MDACNTNKTPIKLNENIKQKRSYKVDGSCGRHWVECMENGRLACMLTVENESIAHWLGDTWEGTGVIDWNGFLFDSINMIVIA